MIYIIANGLTNDIIESEVGKKMKDKMEEFNEDRELRLTAYNRIMKKAAHETEIKVAREKGREAGREEGREEEKIRNNREKTFKLFNMIYPNDDKSFLEDLSSEQYDKIFDMLINGESLKAIKAFVEK